MRRSNWPPKAGIRATLTSIQKKWRSCLLHSDVVSAIVAEGDGLFRSQADKAVTAEMEKIDRSTSIGKRQVILSITQHKWVRC
jgi:hypothetical protein